MSTTTSNPFPQMPNLSMAQRNLLMAALASNKRSKQNGNAAAPADQANEYFPPFPQTIAPTKVQQNNFDGVNPAIFDISQEQYPTSGYDSTFDDSLLSQFDNTGSLDFGTIGNDDLQSPDSYDNESHEKRKSPDEDDDDEDEESSHKKQEGDDKIAKKPGRKLITAEPTTKRKAQNRAAQRAFRERKEKHLKDLEQKVNDLEKSSETTNHENGILRAQITRLQTELADYKKRLSNISGLSQSPPSAAYPSFNAGKGRPSGGASDFQFDFTKFGQNSSFRQMSSASSTSNTNNQTRHNSRSLSPQQDSMTSSWTAASSNAGRPTLTQSPANSNHFAIFDGMTQTGNIDFTGVPTTTAAVPTAGACPSLCHSETHSSGASPAASTPDNLFNTTSEDSPAPLLNTETTPATKTSDFLNFDFNNFGDNTGFGQFGATDATNNNNFDFGIDWLANQNGGQFDPVLFNDYRESQDAIIGGGDFSGGLFDDTFALPNLNNNFNFDLSPQQNLFQTPSAPAPVANKPSLMDQVEACRNGEVGENDGLVIPAEDVQPIDKDKVQKAQMMTAHKIWTELQSCPKFKRGELDIDSLCSELSKKATCSETGLQVPKEVVEATLWKLVGDDNEAGQIMKRVEASSQH